MLHSPLEAGAEPHVGPAQSGYFVYVIDDQAALRQSSCFLLSALGIGCVQYPSGRTFLDDIEKLRPGCILLDVIMSGMDGFEVQTELNRYGIRWPVIFMSGHQDVNTVAQAMKNGAIEFLEKPFPDEQLLAALHRGFVRLRSLEPA